MAVYCRQLIDGIQSGDEYIIDPGHHADLDSDIELLLRKAAGAEAKGWTVEWTSPTSFTATKARWEEDAACERRFRIG